MEERLDPDLLMQTLQAQEKLQGKGRLKIFLGMAAGVGKTYSMLEAAQKQAKEGINLYVGTVVTHGRAETAKLLEGLKVIPQKTIYYKDREFQEFDIDKALQIHPQLILVDELAHTNVPGSRHLKRWQDVMELLEAGIDVYTTLNIQHVESFKDIVEKIANINIRETVPDVLLELASNIELVDLSAKELIQRLEEGKVYTGELTEIAIQNFFQEDRLTALREIALRFTAEVVDRTLHMMFTSLQNRKGWRPRERLLVAIHHTLDSQQLIRAARRHSFVLHAPWIALYVDHGKMLNEQQTAMLSKNLALARQLGAEVITVKDTNLVQGIQRVAQQKGITQIIIGKTTKSLKHLFKHSIVQQLTQASSDMDVLVIQRDLVQGPQQPISKSFIQTKFYAYNLGGLAVLTLAAAALIPHVGLVAPLALFFMATFYASCVMSRLQARQAMLIKQEDSIRAIYEIVQHIAIAPSLDVLLSSFKEKVGKILNGTCEIFTHKKGSSFDVQMTNIKDPHEQAVAKWVFDHKEEAGWSTSTLSDAKYYYLPLKGFKDMVGVFAFKPEAPTFLLLDETNFLYTVTQQLANHLERCATEEVEREARAFQKMEKMYERVLRSISQQLYMPLKTLKSSVMELKNHVAFQSYPDAKTSLQQMRESLDHLIHVTDNAAEMAKLSAGLISFQKSSQNLSSLLYGCVKKAEKFLVDHDVSILVPSEPAEILCDFNLIETLILNLLMNAAEYSPPRTKIELKADVLDECLVISVSDEGPGIPEALIEKIFEKFYRVPGTQSSGLGLGLAIASSIAAIHDGHIKVNNLPGGGAKFSLELPLK
ncbi:MAG: sensor histidine kinase KdpD [Verrucomicrobia bacterium]|nr:sensor histidine kinase KdpD [Verrucomicrobiota bacterium]MBS0645242.1 sensor histidine kinase KdpD [Verrucomicrobiota bacterium]